MKKFYKWFKKNQLYINRTFLFMVGVILVYFTMPDEGRFGKDYEKNEVWRHEDYMAPFDFPIYKTQEQLKAEKDSLLKNFKLYFQFDSTIYDIQRQRAVKALLNYQNDTVLDERTDTLFNKYILSPLREMYKMGIVDRIDVFEQYPEGKDIFIDVLRNNIAQEYALEEVFTQKEAYEYLMIKLNEISSNRILKKMPKFARYVNEFSFNQLIEANLIYSEEKTEKAKFELVKNVSLYVGNQVKKGTRIISKGEVVDATKFQVLESLKKKYESWVVESANYYLIVLGKFLVIFICFLMLFLFLYHFRFEVLGELRKSVFVVFIATVFIVFSTLMIRYGVGHYFIFPFAMLPIIVRAFYDDRLALFVHLITIFIVGYIVPNAYEFIILNFVAGMVAIYSMNNLYRRRRLVITSLLIFISYALVYSSLNIVTTGNIEDIEINNYLWFGINGLFIFLIYPIIYLFERMFGFLSDVSLMELSDTNQKLLRKLAEEAPGTFQHSMQVASLAEEAIYRIGGNTLLVRTGALYHDIGKLKNPSYFTENQKNNENPHDNHEYEESARIIIDHVTYGIELAKKNNLPEQIINFIKTHHGTTTVRYFYKSFVNENPGVPVDIKKFKYPGPIPFSKETAVLMMADSVEAASRSLTDLNEETIRNLVDSIIDYQLAEDQFNDADITFRDINNIKKVFIKKLSNIYHVRIQYPE